MRTISSADESNGYSFVPDLALLVAVALALCSIAVLIFFIHHVPSNIHINSVIQDIGKRLIREIDHRFPRHIGSGFEGKRGDEVSTGDGRRPSLFRSSATFAPPSFSQRESERILVSVSAFGFFDMMFIHLIRCG